MSASVTDPILFEVLRGVRAEAARIGAPLAALRHACRIALRELDAQRTPAVCVAEASRFMRTHTNHGPATA